MALARLVATLSLGCADKKIVSTLTIFAVPMVADPESAVQP